MATVHKVISKSASGKQMEVIANIGGQLLTKHIHKHPDGEWYYKHGDAMRQIKV